MLLKRILVALLCAMLACVVPALAEDFMLGVDVSELAAQENSGVRYFDSEGAGGDALAILADSGVNHVRLRVWNDPFDAEGHGYGAGNIDAETAAQLSARAAAQGMNTLVDFHYSDFWADPSRQIVPKAWAGMGLDEKERALYDYTRDTLFAILDAGGDVDMVQIGNEINYGMCGEYDDGAMARLVAAGCSAAREVAASSGRDLRVCVHLANPEDYGRIAELLDLLSGSADFDAVGLSYYPYWHGSLDNLGDVVNAVRRDFGKDVFIAETAWPFTLEQGDGWPDVVDYDPGQYGVSPDGQAQAFADVCQTARDAGALGVFYWGGIWTPVGDDPDANWPLWETYGSGWATSYAADYDPEHVGDSYGGSAWDNQAMFDFGGHPLPILDLIRSLAGGEAPEPATDAPAPESPAPEEASGAEDVNLVQNPSFEDADYSMWQAESLLPDIPFDYQDFVNDAHSGTVAFHYWSESDMHFTIQQTLTDLAEGLYTASVWSQGGDMTDATLTLYVEADGQRYEASFENTSWADWQHPVLTGIPVTSGSLTVGAEIRCGALSWGTLDDFTVSPDPAR